MKWFDSPLYKMWQSICQGSAQSSGLSDTVELSNWCQHEIQTLDGDGGGGNDVDDN